MTVEFVTSSREETIALGRTLGSLLREDDVLVLTGDLGAGKTQLTKGIARGMGILGDVTSPTFTIEMVYEGERMPLYHFDLYRLVDAGELEDIGLYTLRFPIWNRQNDRQQEQRASAFNRASQRRPDDRLSPRLF